MMTKEMMVDPMRVWSVQQVMEFFECSDIDEVIGRAEVLYRYICPEGEGKNNVHEATFTVVGEE